MDILKVERTDLPRILEIYEAARVQMVQTGNPDQWINGYPDQGLLEADITNGQLYKVLNDRVIVGVFMLVPGPDAVYSQIDGAWLNDASYLVIHRIAAQGGKGITKAVFRWVMDRTDNLRIDTHNNNRIMRQLLEKAGFVYTGELTLPDGAARRAYHLTTKAP